jgi:hypothetical protein
MLPISPLDENFYDKALKGQQGSDLLADGRPAIPARSSSRNYLRPKSFMLGSTSSDIEEDDETFRVIDGIDQSIGAWVSVGADTDGGPATRRQSVDSSSALPPPSSPSASSDSGCLTLSSVSSHFYRRRAVYIPFDENDDMEAGSFIDELGAEDFDPFVETDEGAEYLDDTNEYTAFSRVSPVAVF